MGSGQEIRSEQTRRGILEAALREFAEEGIAGARTDAIARAAGVNKALLYYYFRDKEALYGAALDQVFSALTRRLRAALARPLPPRQRILAYAGEYFDFVSSNPSYPRLVQRELMRAGRQTSPHLRRIVKRFLRPTLEKVSRLLKEGITAGDFRPVDARHFVPSMVAVTVFYFSSLPMVRAVFPGDPLSPRRIAERRAAVLDFISAALFQNRPGLRRNRRPEGRP